MWKKYVTKSIDGLWSRIRPARCTSKISRSLALFFRIVCTWRAMDLFKNKMPSDCSRKNALIKQATSWTWTSSLRALPSVSCCFAFPIRELEPGFRKMPSVVQPSSSESLSQSCLRVHGTVRAAPLADATWTVRATRLANALFFAMSALSNLFVFAAWKERRDAICMWEGEEVWVEGRCEPQHQRRDVPIRKRECTMCLSKHCVKGLHTTPLSSLMYISIFLSLLSPFFFCYVAQMVKWRRRVCCGGGRNGDGKPRQYSTQREQM